MSDDTTSARHDVLHGSRWELRHGDAVAWLAFADGSVHGSDGCNSIRGSYTPADGGGVITGPVMSTLKACSGDAAELAASLGALVADGATLSVEGDGLLLLGPNGVVARFVAPATPTGRWSVIAVHWPDRHAVISVADGHVVEVVQNPGDDTLRFDLVGAPPNAEPDEVAAVAAAVHTAEGWRQEGDLVRLLRDGELTAATLRRVAD